MIKIASQVLDSIGQFIDEHPTATMGLLGGGLGAAGGWLATGDDPEETPEERTRRRIRNALILGGLGAGAGALLSESVGNLSTAIPQKVTTPEEDTAAFFRSWINPYTVGPAAGIGSAIGLNGLRNLAQSDLKQKIHQLVGDGKKWGVSPISDKASMSELRAALPEMIAKMNGTKKGVPAEFLNALKSQFGAEELKDLPAALHNYDISTSELEKLPAVQNALKDSSEWGREAMKFLRRNWRVGIPAGIVAGLSGAALAN